MTLVVDASVVVAALVDSGPTGVWSESMLMRGELFAPHLMPVEVTNVLRRTEGSHTVSEDTAALAVRDLADLPVTLLPFSPVAARVWELRRSVTAYDAVYVAWAEALECPLVTLDHRLTRAAGPRCTFTVA